MIKSDVTVNYFLLKYLVFKLFIAIFVLFTYRSNTKKISNYVVRSNFSIRYKGNYCAVQR